ncbi:hypothetical protein HN695_00020 [Candidatus Woesearchaeota archaeon]|jgi:hypothetical protein|nr:hypothetical protein [Candidatus Woesearchaeota archaeon]MBT5271697.1 hypothetical protein [Candidatus Woesearchaeota archaeon]MBT6041113.1 hypothetical protein [Candidatus Woesearchaeota archaeon]MBT6337438.1 hypothetical protein [Candidatus Woesearchaeota archaeon]MBT7926698.1 hypothetical protein [Candidatus Woesearchaeota archaeon]
MAKKKNLSMYLTVLIALIVLFGLVVILDGCSTLINEDVADTSEDVGEDVVEGDALPGEVEESGDLAGEARKSVRWYGCQDPDASTTYDTQQLFEKSTTTYNGGSRTDKCYTFSNGKEYLFEWICRNGKINRWQKNCAELNLGEPGADYQCDDGACVDMAEPEEEEEVSELLCDEDVETPSSWDYKQKILFTNDQTGQFVTKQIQGVTTNVLKFKDSSSKPMFNYKLTFDQAQDPNGLLGKSIELQGKQFRILHVYKSNGDVKGVDLVDGVSESLDVGDVYNPGIHTVQVKGAEVSQFDDEYKMSCGFDFNGVEHWVNLGESKIINGVVVSVIEVYSDPSSCKLQFGLKKISIKDGSEVMINGNKISDITDFYAQGIINENQNLPGLLSTIAYKVSPDYDTVYLTVGDEVVDPIIEGFKIALSGNSNGVGEVKVSSNSGSDSYEFNLALDQAISQVESMLSEAELSFVLADGSYEPGLYNIVCVETEDQPNNLDYKQKLYFMHPETGVLVYDQEPVLAPQLGHYLFVEDLPSKPLYKYELTFDSAVDKDYLAGKKVGILGNDYYISRIKLMNNGEIMSFNLTSGVNMWLSDEQYQHPNGQVIEVVNTEDDYGDHKSRCKVKVNGDEVWIGNGGSKQVVGLNIGVFDVKLAQPHGACRLVVGGKEISLKNDVELKVNQEKISQITSFYSDGVLNTYGESPDFLVSKFGYEINPDADELYLAEGDELVDPVFSTFKLSYAELVEGNQPYAKVNIIAGQESYEMGNGWNQEYLYVDKSLNEIDSQLTNAELPGLLGSGSLE